MKKILFLFVTAVFLIIGVTAAYAQRGAEKINVVLKNSTDRAVVFGSMLNNPTRPGGELRLQVNKGRNMIMVLFSNTAGTALDTVTLSATFNRDGDVFELTTSQLGIASTSQSQNQNQVKKGDGKKIENRLDGKLFFQDRGICLSPGETSKNLVKLSPNERIVIEKNNRLFFLEISDFFAKNDKVYTVDANTLIQGSGRDSVMISLTASTTPYVYIDDQTKIVKGISNAKGRGEYRRNFVEGANTILTQILAPDGTAEIRYYTFMASAGNTVVCPTQASFENPPLYYGDKKNLPIKGFEKSCSLELLDITGKTAFEIIIDENDIIKPHGFFIGMNQIRITYFEKTPQGRIKYSFEYFKLISETDTVFEINPAYFWLLQGQPVKVALKNATKNVLFQNIEIWSMNKELNPRNIVIKKDYPSEKTYIREGIVRLPGRYTEGLTIRNLTSSFIISSQDKNGEVEIRDSNIDRTQPE
jgi:hypothetical protein